MFIAVYQPNNNANSKTKKGKTIWAKLVSHATKSDEGKREYVESKKTG